MPLFTITMRSGRRGADKGAVSAAIHAASVSAGYPVAKAEREAANA
jgi:hypothetical protein